ncbi:MAG: DsrE/DsrF/TusD sulfur relay family protein [Candidatus Helarchaeota archaeon]
MGTILFISKETPYQTENTTTLINMAKAAQDEGHKVIIFMYMDGIYGALKGQFLEKGKAISEIFKKLIENGAEINLCNVCVKTRGFNEKDGNFIEGVKIGGLFKGLTISMEQADRVISL